MNNVLNLDRQNPVAPQLYEHGGAFNGISEGDSRRVRRTIVHVHVAKRSAYIISPLAWSSILLSDMATEPHGEYCNCTCIY